jgi:hypothetical protein
MEVLKRLLTTVVTLCVLTVGAFGLPQRNDRRQRPPDKKEKEIRKSDKGKPPPRNDKNRGGGDRRGKP